MAERGTGCPVADGNYFTDDLQSLVSSKTRNKVSIKPAF